MRASLQFCAAEVGKLSDAQLADEWLLWQELALLCVRQPELAKVGAELYEDLYSTVADIIGVCGIPANMVFGNAHQLRCEIELVETPRVLAHRFVATPPNIIDDSADGFLDGLLEFI